MLDFPIAPPIRVKDSERRLDTLNDARAYLHEALAVRRTAAWRDLQARLDGARSEDEAIEAIGALRELLAMEGLLVSSASSHA